MINTNIIINGLSFEDWKDLREILDKANDLQLRRILMKCVNKLPEEMLILKREV